MANRTVMNDLMGKPNLVPWSSSGSPALGRQGMVGIQIASHRALLRSRRGQRGASIFVVMSVLMVLTALGVFAAHTAGLNQRVSGYAKQGTQSTYVADMGTIAVVDEMSGESAGAYMQLVLAGTEPCRANEQVVGAVDLPCYRLTKTDLQARMTAESAGSAAMFDPTGLSSPLTAVTADFVVEMTDPGPSMRPIAGMGQSDVGPRFRYMQVTFTGLGQLRPVVSSTNSASIAGMAAVRANRAVVQVGPLPY